MLTRSALVSARRVVVKVGTSTLTYANGKLNFLRIERLVRELSDLANAGRHIILVTSGAVGIGAEKLGLKERPKTIREKQAAAAVGQGLLMHVYEKLFGEYGQTVGQVLLTRDDYVNRKRYINSRNTFLTLLEMGVIPIVNENDAVAVDELKIGDNDTLSAMVGGIVDADALIILSDVEGVFAENPQTNPNAPLIREITTIGPELERICGGPGSAAGTGGMHTKIEAARIAVNSGMIMVIASGARDGVIRDILTGAEVGTVFLPTGNRPRFRKRWLAFGARMRGAIVVDKGCEHAIQTGGSSLLAAGVVSVTGSFEAGDTVRVVNCAGREIGRGIVNYSAADIAKIAGMHTGQIADIIGHKPYDEIIHRDNMVIFT